VGVINLAQLLAEAGPIFGSDRLSWAGRQRERRRAACWHTGVPYDPAIHQARQRLTA
jgi:hypothetical protein